jgi:peptide/nickel transport system permease protein
MSEAAVVHSEVAPSRSSAVRRVLLPVRNSLARGREHPTLAAGLALVAAFALVAVLAPVIAPANPQTIDVSHILEPPFSSSAHPLGTDELGRDELSRLVYGARIDLPLGIGIIIVPFVFGTMVGAIAAYRGGAVDAVVLRIIDVVLAFPIIVLTIALVFAIGPGVLGIALAIALVDWVAYARLVRSGIVREKTLDYALAAKTSGLSDRRILFRHLLPNVIGQSVVYAMSDIVVIILAIVTLGFLGLGIPPPAPDWGSMISDAQPFVTTQWWLAVFPGAAIFFIGLAFSMIGDGMARILDAE